MLSLLVCVRSAELRHALCRCAEHVVGVDVVDSAAGLAEARIRVGLSRPDAVLLDARLPGTPDTLRALVEAMGDRPALMVGDPGDLRAMAAGMAAGVRGFLSPDLAPEELAAALAHGSLTTPVAAGLIPRQRLPGPRLRLTERELQVLQGMAAGRSNVEIGHSLYLSEDTIKTHARRLYQKLEVHDRAHAVASGFRMGLVS